MQARLEEEEMESMRLGAALATLRADMESLSAAHVPVAPGTAGYLIDPSTLRLQALGVQDMWSKVHAWPQLHLIDSSTH